MKESAVQFGPWERLSGVLSEPTSGDVRAVFALANCGFIPRSGPCRVYTELARTLAHEGVAVLRYDLGGLGDSIAARDGRLIERTEREVAAAVDCLAQRFPNVPVAIGGICSGAEDSLRHAAVDERVQRVVLVDPFAWRTRGWAWRHLAFRVYRRALRALRLWRPAPGGFDPDWVDFQHMEPDEATALLRACRDRGGRVHFVYTGGRRELFNHAEQLVKMFPHEDVSGYTSVDFHPALGHTQLMQAERDAIVGAITRRLASLGDSPATRRD